MKDNRCISAHHQAMTEHDQAYPQIGLEKVCLAEVFENLPGCHEVMTARELT